MNVTIRKLRLSDIEDLRRCLNDKDVIKRLDDEDIKYPFTLKVAKKYISNSLKDKNAHEFAILLDGKYVGNIVLENPTKTKKCYELGYAIGKKYWGQGIATKAVKLMIEYGFKKLKTKRIWAGVLSNNPASAKVLKKCGFKQEGRLRKHTFKNGKYYDDLIFGLIK
ncbi:GNAT family N-acetyltransferase [Candidatus Woesearchaeota archaeon]|nr:GNAT family N-acetyltransferase [Candidatus Woesearchaeota archaeon]